MWNSREQRCHWRQLDVMMRRPKHGPGEGEDFDMTKSWEQSSSGHSCWCRRFAERRFFSAPNVGFIAIALSIGAAVLAMAYALVRFPAAISILP